MTMTYSGNFRDREYLNENNNNNYLSHRNNKSFSINDADGKYYRNSPNTNSRGNINAVTNSSYSIIENINYKINLIDNNKDKNIISYRIDKNPLCKKKNSSYNFSYTDNGTFKEENLSNNNKVIKKKITLYSNYYYKDRNKSNQKIKRFLEKEKNNTNNQLCSIKNISTKDKRIFIQIKYICYTYNINKINNNKKTLNTAKIFEFNYIPKKRIRKRINKRKNGLKNKLSLIKEEEEKNASIKITENKSVKYISNIIIKDKIFLNNIFINNNRTLLGSHSLDINKGFNIIDSSTLKTLKKSISKDNINI